MAETNNQVVNEEEKKTGGGGGNKNALAYGLLQGAGINTEGMSPSEAWARVDALHLMERNQRKKTDEEEKDYKDKNENAKKQGKTKKTAIENAGKISEHVALHSDNVAGVNTAIDAATEIMNEYDLNKLKRISTVNHIGKGIYSALASANGGELNIGHSLLRNPGAFYRSAVENYKKEQKTEIDRLTKEFNSAKSPKAKEKLGNLLKNKKDNLGYTRSNVVYKGEEVKSTIYHEMGHIIADQLCGQINGRIFLKKNISQNEAKQKIQLIEQTYIDCVGNNDIYKISEYAGTNEHEFFAECFAIYKMGKEKLPDNIEKMIKGVLK